MSQFFRGKPLGVRGGQGKCKEESRSNPDGLSFQQRNILTLKTLEVIFKGVIYMNLCNYLFQYY